MLNILLALITVTALAVAWSQWRLQRTTAGGRGLFLGAGRTGHRFVRETREGNVTTDSYRVDVGVAGPKVWHELAVSLEKDGRVFEAPNRPETRKSMDCDSERITWEVHLSPEDGEKVWCVVSWAAARGDALRTDALTRGFHGKSLWGWVVHEEWCSDLG